MGCENCAEEPEGTFELNGIITVDLVCKCQCETCSEGTIDLHPLDARLCFECALTEVRQWEKMGTKI